MKILVVIPVINKIWTQLSKRYLEKIKRPETIVDCRGIKEGPSSIDTFWDEAFATYPTLRLVKEFGSAYDAIIINCFLDPALKAAREISDVPVMGIGESSMLIACMFGKFSVISTLKNSIPWTELQVRELGVEQHLASVKCVEIPVSAIARRQTEVIKKTIKSSKEAIREDYAEAIVLGCGALATFAEKIKKNLNVPLVEPLATTLKVTESILDLGLTHSKVLLYSGKG